MRRIDDSTTARFLQNGCGRRRVRLRLPNQSNCFSILFSFLTGVIALTGCVKFQPQAISPEVTAARLESRSLDSPELKAFLERNLRRELTAWPLKSWDFPTLT